MNGNMRNTGIDKESIVGALDALRGGNPLVHCITNYVTVNDCANALLAAGAAPVMADDAAEVEDIVSIASSLVVNIGTLNERTIHSMKLAAIAAKKRGIPTVLDPVGAGASRLRTETALALVGEIGFSVIRGNSSEIRTLLAGTGVTRGVDADPADSADDALGKTADAAVLLAKRTGAVVVATGATDIVTDGAAVFGIRNGHPLMARITGSGCMLSAIVGAFVAARQEHLLEAVAAGVSFMGLAGERAARDVGSAGTASYRTRLIDQLSIVGRAEFEEGARIERRA